MGFAYFPHTPDDIRSMLERIGVATIDDLYADVPDDVIFHEAAKYISLNRLSLSPQCGFASCEIGNKLTDAEQWAKIDLVREISEEVWGSSSFSDAE